MGRAIAESYAEWRGKAVSVRNSHPRDNSAFIWMAGRDLVTVRVDLDHAPAGLDSMTQPGGAKLITDTPTN